MSFKLALHPCDTFRMNKSLGRSSIQEFDYRAKLLLGFLGGGGRSDSLYSCADSGTLRPIPEPGLSTQLHPLFCTLDVWHLFLEAIYPLHLLASKARSDSRQDQRALRG